jgi:pimeloyl-ACP methyl ester carboxylesterase
MTDIKPNYWVRGSGPTVLCLHCSTCSSRQYEGLAEIISDRYTVVAVDLYGYGDTPMWAGKDLFSLRYEVELLDSVFATREAPSYVIGHSYGGAVALVYTLAHPGAIKGIIAYEPVLFNLLLGDIGSREAAQEISRVKNEVSSLVSRGLLAEAARAFVDYWSGAGAFDSMSDRVKAIVSNQIPKVTLDFEAVLNADAKLDDYRGVSTPSVLLYGLDSPPPTRRIVHLLAEALPHAEVRGLLGLGHMGMAVDKEMINRVTANFLDQLSARPKAESLMPPVR